MFEFWTMSQDLLALIFIVFLLLFSVLDVFMNLPSFWISNHTLCIVKIEWELKRLILGSFLLSGPKCMHFAYFLSYSSAFFQPLKAALVFVPTETDWFANLFRTILIMGLSSKYSVCSFKCVHLVNEMDRRFSYWISYQSLESLCFDSPSQSSLLWDMFELCKSLSVYLPFSSFFLQALYSSKLELINIKLKSQFGDN